MWFGNMEGAAWYELLITANRKYQPFDEVEFDDQLTVMQEAARLTIELRKEMDIGSWEVRILPHWCDKSGPCDCETKRPVDKPFASFTGMVLNF